MRCVLRADPAGVLQLDFEEGNEWEGKGRERAGEWKGGEGKRGEGNGKGRTVKPTSKNYGYGLGEW